MPTEPDAGSLPLLQQRTRLGSAWPFITVILVQMLVAGLSVYTLSAIRAFVTGESLWSKGQHEAVYFLTLYLDTDKPKHLEEFRRAIAVPLAYREGRRALERRPMDYAATKAAWIRGGTAAEDVPSVIWMFRYFRGLPYLEMAIDRWKAGDGYILELERLGNEIGDGFSPAAAGDLRARVEAIDQAITPLAIVFSRTLVDGARVVEQALLFVNLVLAAVLAGLTIWRVGRTLAQRNRLETVLAWQASHDDLTGIVNRRAFELRLREAVKLRSGKPPNACALMFVDLDQFKLINDTCGHTAGDAMLRKIGPAVQKLLGADGLIARLGGDEFGLLVQGLDAAVSLVLAEAVRQAIEQIDLIWDDRRFVISASIGFVHDATGLVTPEEMMSRADIACLLAKEKGRNRIQVHREDDQEMHGRLRDMNWVQRIQRAFDEDRFRLHAQEIVALDASAPSGLHIEVLLRLEDQNGLLVPPSSFLPAAERFGLMKQVDRWVVRATFRTLAERGRAGSVMPISCCGINLSGATIGDGDFLDFLKGAFAEFAVDPRTICFEITETVAIVDLGTARAFIDDLKDLGCTFALDDFGSGMSSFSYLKELPVDVLKIDGAFVRNLLTERPDRAMVEMISHVGHIMGKRIVAEFVETIETAEALREIGIDFVQGFGIAVPRPFTAAFQSEARRPHRPAGSVEHAPTRPAPLPRARVIGPEHPSGGRGEPPPSQPALRPGAWSRNVT